MPLDPASCARWAAGWAANPVVSSVETRCWHWLRCAADSEMPRLSDARIAASPRTRPSPAVRSAAAYWVPCDRVSCVGNRCSLTACSPVTRYPRNRPAPESPQQYQRMVLKCTQCRVLCRLLLDELFLDELLRGKTTVCRDPQCDVMRQDASRVVRR